MKDILYGHEITEESIPAKLKREEAEIKAKELEIREKIEKVRE